VKTWRSYFDQNLGEFQSFPMVRHLLYFHFPFQSGNRFICKLLMPPWSHRDTLQTYFQKVSPTCQTKAKIFPSKKWAESGPYRLIFFWQIPICCWFLLSLSHGKNSLRIFLTNVNMISLWLPLIHLIYRLSRLSKFDMNFKSSDQHLFPEQDLISPPSRS